MAPANRIKVSITIFQTACQATNSRLEKGIQEGEPELAALQLLNESVMSTMEYKFMVNL